LVSRAFPTPLLQIFFVQFGVLSPGAVEEAHQSSGSNGRIVGRIGEEVRGIIADDAADTRQGQRHRRLARVCGGFIGYTAQQVAVDGLATVASRDRAAATTSPSSAASAAAGELVRPLRPQPNSASAVAPIYGELGTA